MDDRRDEREAGRYGGRRAGDAAVFAVARVGGGSGRRASTYGIVLGLVMAAVLGLAVFDGSLPAGRPEAAANRTAPEPERASQAPVTPNPVIASKLEITSRALAGYVIVHGDVLTYDAEIVVVSIRDRQNRILGVQTVDMPKGSTAFRTGANDRFQIAFDLGDQPVATVAYVVANAYDRTGRQIATDRQSLFPADDPTWGRVTID
ncbi:MAG TPA: hypothetical protein VNL94_04940 [Candidatus Binatia bacterium]|nr:hypothetical protein [Candidatus Binatia bacterium]